MMIGIVYALLASTLNLTILGNLLGSGIPIQLSVVGATLGWLYGQSRFSWTVMLVSGLLYDTLATTRFGLYLLLFFIAGVVIEQSVARRAHYGTGATLFISTALTGAIIYATTLTGAGLGITGFAFSILAAAILTGGATILGAQIIKRFER